MLAERIGRVVAEWAAENGWDDVPALLLERPAEEAHGDYATALCLQMAKSAKRPPRLLAEQLRERLLLDAELARLVDEIEVAGPGFLNFTLSNAAYTEAMTEMLAEGDAIGGAEVRTHPRVNLEFVSVNPNGPLHVGHGRYAAYGDSLRRLLHFSGLNVATEFYINDFGRQMDRFGRSVAARYAQSFGLDLPVPEDGYQGDYVKDAADSVRAEVGDRWVETLQLVWQRRRMRRGSTPGPARCRWQGRRRTKRTSHRHPSGRPIRGWRRRSPSSEPVHALLCSRR